MLMSFTPPHIKVIQIKIDEETHKAFVAAKKRWHATSNEDFIKKMIEKE